MKLRAPRNEVERRLERLQIDVTRGERAREERDRLIYEMWQAGMPQSEIARRLTRAAYRVNGEAVSRNAIQKVCAKLGNGGTHDQ